MAFCFATQLRGRTSIALHPLRSPLLVDADNVAKSLHPRKSRQRLFLVFIATGEKRMIGSQRAEDLNRLDRIDAELGLERCILIQHVDRIARSLADRIEQIFAE